MATQSKKKATKTTKQTTTSTKKSIRQRHTTAKAPQKQGLFAAIRGRVDGFLARRPHRTFRLTRRRDYVRSFKIEGYWAFTLSVIRLVGKNKKTLALLALTYGVISALILGIASQDSFIELQRAINQAGQQVFNGDWGDVGTAMMLTLSTITGTVAPALTESQQIYAVLFGLLVWLTTVWLLRQSMAGHTPRLRDGLYSAGAPLVSTVVVMLAVALQLLPILAVMIGYTAAENTGLLNGGVEAMLFWVAALGLVTLSFYWISASALALVVVTLPGMYPFRALKVAGDLVVGRRLRILLRMLWVVFLLLLSWIIILVPVILLDTGLKNLWPVISWLPVVPVIIAVLSTVSVVWMASYIYVLYRKIVDDDAKPA